MTEGSTEIIPRWFGVFLVRGGRIVDRRLYDSGRSNLQERLAQRREGIVGLEEATLTRESGPTGLQSRDRRLGSLGVRLVRRPSGPLPDLDPPPRAVQRELVLSDAERALRESWDPSVHLLESVRSVEDLDGVLNTLGERLESWAERDLVAGSTDEERSAGQWATRLASGAFSSVPELAPPDPATTRARATLAKLYLAARQAREEIESSLHESMPRRAPNLSQLLGPVLAARMIAQAGGLDRLARLPASTIQVLGAEGAFFEHLRGHGPPPRHGLLFLHPEIQGRPRRERGKVARALAGKVAIAARLDQAGAPLRPSLAEQFERRAADIRRPARKPRGPRPRPSPSI